jgi:radical SAM family uncharacterized protein/radical SAM-linked protein
MQLEHYLCSVTKPGRYVDCEYNAVIKDHREVEVSIALCYPDLYEIGMSNYGINILYNIINGRDDALCERVFAVWTDCESVMRAHQLPMVSLETGTPLSDFDILGFSLEYELTYTNMLTVLDLAGIPLRAEQRSGRDPLVIGGGTAVYNPEPIAPFLDAVVIGEGEEVIGEIIDLVKELKRGGVTRNEVLRMLGAIPGVYVPAVHDGEIPVKRRYIRELKGNMYPSAPVVPYIAITHDRLTVEIMRGCTQGCRFCQAGFLTRPVREVPLDDIVERAVTGIKRTGWEEVSLLSLSASDHTRILQIIEALQSKLTNTAISLPSLRGDSITEDFASAVKAVRRSSLTLAPEAGREELRRSMNKDISDDAILSSCEVAMKHGWKKLKLYFMIGLPFETSMDVESIVELVRKIRGITGRMALKISISPFVPKPHTPFERFPQDSLYLLKEKERCIRQGLEKQRIEVSWRNPEVSFLEAVFSRGDRSLAEVIETAWRMGSRFEEWSEVFDFGIWQKAFDTCGIEPDNFRRALKGSLPWSYIDTGVDREYLKKEVQKAEERVVTENCAQSGCRNCGVCDIEGRRKIEKKRVRVMQGSTPEYGRKRRKVTQVSPLSKKRIRVRYSKMGKLRFISHLDTIRLITRAIRRAQIHVAYTQGYRRRPRVAFGPPLPIGVTARSEYFDMLFEQPFSGDIAALLNGALPDLLRIQEAVPVFIKSPSLSKIISLLKYRVGPVEVSEERIRGFLAREKIPIMRTKDGEEVEIDIRPFIHSIERNGEHLDIGIRFLPEGSLRLDELLACFGVPLQDDLMKERVALQAEKGGVFVDPLKFNL